MLSDELFIDFDKLPGPLPDAQVYELLDKIKQGDQVAMNKLAKHNIKLVVNRVLDRFGAVQYDKQDLVSIGNIGLIKAIKACNEFKRGTFSAFVIKFVDNEILRFLEKKKNDENTISIDEPYIYDNGDEAKIEDIISDELDIADEYDKNEIRLIIRQIVDNLPYSERKVVMLYFGFYDENPLSYKEIADMMSLEPITVLMIMNKILEEISRQLNLKNVVDLKILPRRRKVKLKTLYELLGDYSREQVDAILEKLSEEDRVLIELRYGGNLDNPVYTKMSPNDEKKFYNLLLRKMKRMLFEFNEEKKLNEIVPLYELLGDYPREQVDAMLEVLPEEDKELIKTIYEGNVVDNSKEIQKSYGMLVRKMRKMLSGPNGDKKPRKLRTIYELLSKYSREQVDAVLEELPEEDKVLITDIYGDDLMNPVYTVLGPEEEQKFYNGPLRKMRRILSDKNKEGRHGKTIYELLGDYPREQVDIILEMLPEKDRILIWDRYGDDLTDPIYKRLDPKQCQKFYCTLIPKMKKKLAKFNGKIEKKGYIFRRTKKNYQKSDILVLDCGFSEDASTDVSSTDATLVSCIMSLKLGLDEKIFSNSDVSEILDIESQEGINITKNKDNNNGGKGSNNKVFYKKKDDKNSSNT